MNIRSFLRPEPGIDARRPTVFGFFVVSQALTVDQR
ncbi:MAG: hypothetical protein AVDCRST_MAG85-366 [uncultured Solirubrobacteraceae bacterium]|uniref:Uncharacterized protein n=1 Tax=uncultured Solirubrobacteraceae bacterium TaxID=1162706 RepID=A0A6J4RLE7_9ACTN|nr:MAG: hypothetical protein AVDCRST_MAG85-366 [uncultured Solirubrobacteraceae bacterium]